MTSLTVASGNPVFDSRDNCNAVINTATNELVIGCNYSTIPNSVTSIGRSAFSGCNVMKHVIIPSSITRIKRDAFSNCDSISAITSLPATAPVLENYSFGNLSAVSVYVPCGSRYSYQSGWSSLYSFTYTEIPPYVFSATSADETMGEVVVLTPATCSAPTATVQAVAKPGYHFTRWNDGNTQNPRSITVSADISLTASFALDTYGISINGTPVTGANASNFTASGLTGSVTYDGAAHVLSLNNVAAEHMSFYGDSDVTVNFSGNNQFSQSIYNNSEHKVTFRGQTATAQLVARVMMAEDVGSDIELANGIFRINEDMFEDYGLYGFGEENRSFSNAEAYIGGGSENAVDSWNSITFTGCEIVSPAGAVVEDGCIKLNGRFVANAVVHIEPVEDAVDIISVTEFVVVPNPAETETVLMLEPYTGTAQMQIVDANGRVLSVVMLPAQQENYRLAVSTLAAGTYFINVTANGTRQTATLVKK